VLVGLSCTKDVQDAVLDDAALSPLIDVIDLKYWWYTTSGTSFAPAGGESLAPRQQLREWSGSTRRTDAEVARAIHEYRRRHPEQAVICSLPGVDPWTALAAGGSLPGLPSTIAAELLRLTPTMRPVRESGDPGGEYSLLSGAGDRLSVLATGSKAEAPPPRSSYIAIDSRTGQFVNSGQPEATSSGGDSHSAPVEYRVIRR
jgi:hypothetical protein